MTLVELEYLVAIGIERHFGRAARACHISQPALSAGLRHLEEELGALLVERGPGGVRLTGVGEQVAEQARRVLDEADKVTVMARRPRAPLNGTLRVGVIATLAPYAMSPLFVPLLRAHRGLDLVLREGLTHELIGLLRLGKLDAALVALPVAEEGIECEALFDEPFFALVPARSKLAKKRTLGAADLVAGRLILLTEGHCFRDQALAMCRGHLAFEEPERDQLAATSLLTIWRMVEAGLGCTLVPHLAATEVRGASRRARIKTLSRPASRRIGAIWRGGSSAARDARALAAFMRAHLPSGLLAVEP